MKSFVGIDLGTTNSAICSFDGDTLRLWKSPEQTDVTPSVIYIDRRGNKHVGQKAYNSAPQSPDNAAMLFKRLMGSSTPVHLKAVNLTLTPEECSAEVLKVLFGYLPEEVRNHPGTGTVITVPAAFNQMQKDATLHAAELAGIGKVALMQEPVAAIMSVMRDRQRSLHRAGCRCAGVKNFPVIGLWPGLHQSAKSGAPAGCTGICRRRRYAGKPGAMA